MKVDSFKIPFRQLIWRDNVLPLGKDMGMIEWIGDLYITDNHRHPFVKYTVSNRSGSDFTETLTAYSNEEDINIGVFDTLEDAQKFCQSDFENQVIKSFFEL